MSTGWVVERFARSKPHNIGLSNNSPLLYIATRQATAVAFVFQWYRRHLVPAKFGPLEWDEFRTEALTESEYDRQLFTVTKHKNVG